MRQPDIHTHRGLVPLLAAAPSTSAHDLSLDVVCPLERIALILMTDFLMLPLAASLTVPKADRTRTEIKHLPIIWPRVVHTPLLCPLAVDRAE
jgi:hypothetical protein